MLTLKDNPKTHCFFCEKDARVSSDADMRLIFVRDFNKSFFGAGGVSTTWKQKELAIPRCHGCRTAHRILLLSSVILFPLTLFLGAAAIVLSGAENLFSESWLSPALLLFSVSLAVFLHSRVRKQVTARGIHPPAFRKNHPEVIRNLNDKWGMQKRSII